MLESLAIVIGRHLRARGTNRLLRLLYPCRHDARRFVNGPRKRADGLWMDLDTRNWIDWNVLFHGTYEPELSELFKRLARPGSVVADIGANIGTHTLTLGRLVGPTGRVLAFEPNPAANQKLARNVALNGLAQVKVYDCALGAHAARMSLRVPVAFGVQALNSGLASLVALDTPHDLVDIDVRTLDDIVAEDGIGRIDFAKIDIQGFEYPALQGMRATIQRCSPVIIFEYEDWAWKKADYAFSDVVALFSRMSYSLFGIRDAKGARFDPIDARVEPTGHLLLIAIHRDDPRMHVLQAKR